MKILLTGATGFIGSNIALHLVEQGHQVIAIHRTDSSFDKCAGFENKIDWINTDSSNWKQRVVEIKPDQLIHVAWGGIKANDRDNWELQLKNFWLSKEYFDLAKELGIKKVIAFGSQAEYGICKTPANEENVPVPLDAYGAVKTLTANYLRTLFEGTKTQWYWLRIFSVFGERENPEWLMPTVIKKLLFGEPIHLTACEQYYNYMYIGDFVRQFNVLVNPTENKSGIYNLCHTESILLKDLLINIAQLMNVSENLLQFGVIPYRQGQNMMIAGDPSKYRKAFSVEDISPEQFEKGLLKTIQYHEK